jgi:hypothetical protein
MKEALKKKFLNLLLLLALASFLGSCAQTRSVRTTIYDDRRTGVVLRGWVDSERQMPVGSDYSHPAEFTVDGLRYLLASIQYQEKGLLGWSGVKHVFTADELYRMTPYLVEAFAKSKPHEEILFHLTSAKPGSFFAFERSTDGSMFVKDGNLNCIFANVDVRAETDLYDGDPRSYYGGGLWKLVKSDWQTLVEDKGEIHYNWVEVDIPQGLAAKQQFEKTLLQRTRTRRRPANQIQPAASQPEKAQNWQDWEQNEEVGETSHGEVYFPDEVAPEKQEH